MIALLLCCAAVLWYLTFRQKRKRLYELAARIPEPKTKYPFIGVVQYTINNNDLPSSLSDANDTEFILKKRLDKPNLLWLLRTVIGNAGIFAPVSIWTRRRKLTVPAFSPKIINSYIDILIQRSDNLSERLSLANRVGTGPFQAWSHIFEYSIEVLFETAFGIDDNTLIKQKKHDFLQKSTDIMDLVTHRAFRIWYWSDFIYKFTDAYRKFVDAKKFTYDFTDEIIQRKRKVLENIADETEIQNGESVKTVRCFLDHLILLSRRDGITDIELREEVLTFLFAGTDTSSVAICNTLKLLAKYPKVQEKLYQEIIEVLGDPTRTLTKDDLQELKYLERVIKESLRLFPPVPFIMREVLEETELPSGTILPNGTNMFISLWAIGRDPSQWGADADCFDPDRFLPDRKTGLFIPFSYGPRNCIGYQFAFMSIKLALIAIVRKFRVTGEEENGPIPHMECIYNIMMKAKDGYEIGLEMR
ncbi:unnamed protein product [Leptosia nina]|uniref:Cytochrome P450 n=1 Tax=Leptosia nina TaxID=320188 RepID=A0AAV1JNA5_9NEOP